MLDSDGVRHRTRSIGARYGISAPNPTIDQRGSFGPLGDHLEQKLRADLGDPTGLN
jgi:hypothetical protein